MMKVKKWNVIQDLELCMLYQFQISSKLTLINNNKF